MGLSLVLVQQRQSAGGIALSWTLSEGAAAHQIFVATRRLSPEELEAAAVLEGTEDCLVAKVGGEVSSVVDDVTPQGEPRHYGVAVISGDGSLRPARFRAAPGGGGPEAFHLSILQGRRAKAASPQKLPAGPDRAPEPPAARAPPLAEALTEPPPPASAVRLAQDLELPMQAATQTWDGLRIFWERDPRAAAYEIFASDHQLLGEEIAEALAGRADFTTVAAVAPGITCVIDNITPREGRGFYAVLVRYRDGRRAPHPFKLGDATASWRPSAPFLNPNRTAELRAEVEGLLAEAREQWARWKSEQDGGARREAKRIVGDALLIWPDHPGARTLLEEMV